MNETTKRIEFSERAVRIISNFVFVESDKYLKNNNSGMMVIITFDSVGNPCLIVSPGLNYRTWGIRDEFGKRYKDELNGAGENPNYYRFCPASMEELVKFLESFTENKGVEITFDKAGNPIINSFSSFYSQCGNNYLFSDVFESEIIASFIPQKKIIKNFHYLYCNGDCVRIKKGRRGKMGVGETESEIFPVACPNGRSPLAFAFNGADVYNLNNKGARFELFRQHNGARSLRVTIDGITHFIVTCFSEETRKAAQAIFSNLDNIVFVPNCSIGDRNRWKENHPEEFQTTEKQKEKEVPDVQKGFPELPQNPEKKHTFGSVEGCFIDGEYINLDFKNGKIILGTKWEGGAVFEIDAGGGRKFYVEFSADWWKDEEETFRETGGKHGIEKRAGAVVDLENLYASLYEFFEDCNIYNDSAEIVDAEYCTKYTIDGYAVDIGSIQEIYCRLTDTGRALELFSENGKMRWIVDCEKPEFNENKMCYEMEIRRIIDAFIIRESEVNEMKKENEPTIETTEKQQPTEQEETKEMNEREKQNNEPETEAGVLPMAEDKITLWGIPLDWERVQVIKHNAQPSGLALMVYNTEGDGALFSMLPGFWAIVKERSRFDENSERFIRDNYDGIICYFDKDPTQAETQEEPEEAPAPVYTESAQWVQDAKDKRTVAVPVVACKLAAPIPVEDTRETPTTRELRYALSLLAMEYTVEELINKWLARTNKPVRKNVVERLLRTIPRESVPKRGESKKDILAAYYAAK